MFVVKIVVAVIIVEAIAEISTEAEIFEGLRGWFDPKPVATASPCGSGGLLHTS